MNHAGLKLGALVGGLLLSGAAQVQAAPTVTFRSSVELPPTVTVSSPTLPPIPTTLTGMSGITPQPFTPGTYAIVTDGPNTLVVNVAVALGNDGSITSATVSSAAREGLSVIDLEDIAFAPGGEMLLVGETSGIVWIKRSPPQGAGWSQLSSTPQSISFTRPNLGFEALAVAREGLLDAARLWVANEEATIQDSPLSSQSSGTLVRIQTLNLAVTDALGTIAWPLLSANGPQWAYLPEPWHGGSISGARSGVVAMTTLPDDRLLVMERALAFNLATPFLTRIYLIDPTGATDTRNLPSLVRTGNTVSGGVVPVSKTLLYQGSHNNVEGLCLGPRLGQGRYALLAITDDGGTADPLSTNRLLSFEISGVACSKSDVAGPNQAVGGDGALTADDIIVFLGWFFAADVRGDMGGANQGLMPDGAWTADDIIVFLNRYFVGC